MREGLICLATFIPNLPSLSLSLFGLLVSPSPSECVRTIFEGHVRILALPASFIATLLATTTLIPTR